MKKVYRSEAASAEATLMSSRPSFLQYCWAASFAFSESGTGSVKESWITPSSRRSP
jgi:hypothetical protein